MEDTNSAQGTGERVLIVEDDPATRSGLAELVQAWGFQTDEASDGEDGLRKITSFRPAIIVSDLVMPRMGGHDLLRTLKDQLSDLTFILLTAQGTVESAVEAIKDGAYDYLSKPVDPQRLKILLQKAVERQETLREVIRCTRDGITINTFMLERSPYMVQFINDLMRINTGRVFVATPDRLGEYILVDYVANKRKHIG